MSWNSKTVVDERERFIAVVLDGELNMSQACAKFGISRKTGYKWLNRAKNGEELVDRSKVPNSVKNKTKDEVESIVLLARNEHPTWGARKLIKHLENQGYSDLPSKTTVENILSRNGAINKEESEKHKPWIRFEKEMPNDLWQMDFKGDFEMLNGNRCFPLDLVDDKSRYVLCLKALDNYRFTTVKAVLIEIFKEYGLPKAILSDNGKPWGDNRKGITEFDVWMMQMDILPIHGKPLHPQTQGKLERFHRTLKSELLSRKVMKNLEDAQSNFDEWLCCYNNERPHESLKMDCPVKHYRKSERKYSENLEEPKYEETEILRKVSGKGYITVNEHRYYLAEALIGKFVALDDLGETIFIRYGKFTIAKITKCDQKLKTTGAFIRK